jgi:3'(2'), 5'-bisphosphate nucleotidase
MVKLSRELEVARNLARQAGAHARALQGAGLRVDLKAGDEPVTAADREASAMIVDGLRAAFPDDAILSEEAVDERDRSRFDKPRVWMIDPIDGTKDFIRGEGGFATMVGLVVGRDVALGVVYQPALDRTYWAVAGEGAWVDGEAGPTRLQVSTVSDMASLRMVASKSHRDETIDRVREVLGISDEMNVGSVGLKLTLIARGERDIYVNPQGHSKLWDACAPQIILTEAGGRLTDALGNAIDYRAEDLRLTRGLIATNALLHDAVVARLASLFAGR